VARFEAKAEALAYLEARVKTTATAKAEYRGLRCGGKSAALHPNEQVRSLGTPPSVEMTWV